jgi:CDGSH-type Zn-finger protein
LSPKNRIKVRENGPLLCTGDIQVVDSEGEVLYSGNDVVLCRCGASANKPFCDGSHRETGFEADGVVQGIDSGGTENDGGLLEITVRNNAMLIARGPMEIAGADNSVAAVRSKAALCRCGKSANKPLCDGSHKTCGFSG